MMLSICIPSVVGREESFNSLVSEIERQIKKAKAEDKVEILTDVDNKEVSIGYKRNRMYQACQGEYAVQIDDDDRVASNYVSSVLDALKSSPDCVGYLEECKINGQIMFSSFSLSHLKWRSLHKPDAMGCVFHRTPFTKTPIKTDICRKVGVKDMRWGEDHEFAKRVRRHIKTEEFINEVMYYYTFDKLTRKEHNERYGIK